MSRTKERFLIPNLYLSSWSEESVKQCATKAPALWFYFFLFLTLLSTVQATTKVRQTMINFPHISYGRQVAAASEIFVDRSNKVFVLLNPFRRTSKNRIRRQAFEGLPEFDLAEGLPGARFPNSPLQDDPDLPTISPLNNVDNFPTDPPVYFRNFSSNQDYLSLLFGNNTNFPYSNISPPPPTEASGDDEDVFNPPIGEGEVDTSRGYDSEVATNTTSWMDLFRNRHLNWPPTTSYQPTTSLLPTSPTTTLSATTKSWRFTSSTIVTTEKTSVAVTDASEPLTTSADNITPKATSSLITSTADAKQLTAKHETKDYISASTPTETSPKVSSGGTYVDADFRPTGGRHQDEKWRTIVIAVLVPALVIAIVTVLALTWVYVLSARWKRHRRIDVEAQPVTNGHTHDRAPGSGSSDTSSAHLPKRNGLTNHNEAWSENGHSTSPR